LKRAFKAVDNWLEITEWIDNGQTEHPVLGEMRMASIITIIASMLTMFLIAYLIASAIFQT
jgi:hypothetical protein